MSIPKPTFVHPGSIFDKLAISHLIVFRGMHSDDPPNLPYILCVFGNCAIFLMTFGYHRKYRRNRSKSQSMIQSTIEQIYFVTIIPSIGCCLVVFHVILTSIFHFLPEYDKNILNYDFYPNDSYRENLYKLFCAVQYVFLIGLAIIIISYLIFSNMLDVLITLLAVQRAVIIFLDEKWHFLVGRRAFQINTTIIWGALILQRVFVIQKAIGIHNIGNYPGIVQYYNYTIILSIFLSFFCTILYISLFYHLFKQRNNAQFWKVPEIAFLYEGVPVLISRLIVSIYSLEPLSKDSDFHSVNIYNYEIRYRIISLAIVQFTYLFDIETMRNVFRKKNCVDLSPTTIIQSSV
ncbi:unnamed protein product [Caenorhabditis angaria]|uniref:Uncharacterized protein n=1 Tax=Caenorhabditis angaria TaxID=860376 RepID=A0A9P1IWT4_9PELO|nr:unnamed protein product [Caenorhabditis angaria]